MARVDPSKLPGALPAASEPGGVFKEIRALVNAVNEGLKMAKELQGMRVGGNPQDPDAREVITGKEAPAKPKELPSPPANPATGLIAMFDILSEQGHGKKRIGDIIKTISPLTIDEIREFLKDAIKPKK